MSMHPSSSIAIFAGFLALIGVSGCDEYPIHDLGYIAGSPPESSDEPALPLPPVAELARDFVGVWVGGAEDPLALQGNADDSPPLFRFASGSPLIRLELSVADGEVFPSGTLTFGDAPLPPTPTDPDVGYPVEPDVSLPTPVGEGSVRPPVEGFAHHIEPVYSQRDLATSNVDQSDFYNEGLALDGKLDFDFFSAEVFAPWCALQTVESCPSNQEWSYDDRGACTAGPANIAMDCMKLTQCLSHVCTCFENQPCTSSYERGSNLTVRLSDDGLVGLFSGAVFLNERGYQQPLGTVHFRREADAAQP
jgi:hypothetical protein